MYSQIIDRTSFLFLSDNKRNFKIVTTSTPIVSSTFTHHDSTVVEESLNSLKKVSTEENWQ